MELQYRYAIVESRTDGFQAIKLLDEPFEGIVYSYYNINFDHDQDKISIKFDYECHDMANKQFGSMEPFEQYIGIVLQKIIATLDNTKDDI